jgi:F-type H+-transporting ATPase subunit delta
VIPALEGYSAAVIAELGEDRDALSAVAAELADINRLVSTNPVLLAGITDTSVPAPARRAILAELLEGKVSRPAHRLASFAAGAVSAPKIPIALSWLADRLTLLAGGEPEEVSTQSLRLARQRLGGFAAAVYEDVATGDLDEIEDELFRFTRTVEATPVLRGALTNPELPPPVRQGVARDLLEGKARLATVMLVSYVILTGRNRDLIGALDWLAVETARARGWRVARVRTANEIDPEQRQRISDALGALTGGPVELQVTVDPSLLSGAIIDIGDLRVNASARGRLTEMREQLVPAGWDRASALDIDDRPGTHTEEGDR